MSDREDLKIEVVTQYRAAADPYTSSIPKSNGGGARLVPISLPKVKWLDRPEIEAPEPRKAKPKMKFDKRGEAGDYVEPSRQLDPVSYALRKLRYARGMSQDDLARRMGCSKKSLGLMERGQVNPHFSLILSWANALGAKIEVTANGD